MPRVSCFSIWDEDINTFINHIFEHAHFQELNIHGLTKENFMEFFYDTGVIGFNKVEVDLHYNYVMEYYKSSNKLPSYSTEHIIGVKFQAFQVLKDLLIHSFPELEEVISGDFDLVFNVAIMNSRPLLAIEAKARTAQNFESNTDRNEITNYNSILIKKFQEFYDISTVVEEKNRLGSHITFLNEIDRIATPTTRQRSLPSATQITIRSETMNNLPADSNTSATSVSFIDKSKGFISGFFARKSFRTENNTTIHLPVAPAPFR